MKKNKLWRALLCALLCAALLCPAFALAEEALVLEDADAVEGAAVESAAEDDAIALETDERFDGIVEVIPELDLSADLDLSGDLALDDGKAADGTVEIEPDFGEQANDESEVAATKVPLAVTYTGPTLTKVYDCNANTLVNVGTREAPKYEFLITPPKASDISLAPVEGSAWVEGHTDVKVKSVRRISAFPGRDVGSYTINITFGLTGDDADYYEAQPVDIPAGITPRPVTITPRAGESKTFGENDKVYPSGTKFSLKNTDGTVVVSQDVSGVVTYGVPKFSNDDKDFLKYLIKDAELQGRDFFPGWLSREPGEAPGRYRITLGTLSFGDNFTITLAEQYFTVNARDINDPSVTIGSIADKTYTGKALTPRPAVRYNGRMLKLNTDYTLKYAKNKNPGAATVTVAGIGNFTGSHKLTFRIVLKPTAISKLTGGSSQFTATWRKGSQNNGYQISYSTDADFFTQTTKTVKGAGKTSLTVKKLQPKTLYYVRVRTYKTVKGAVYYSDWSKAKRVKTK